MKIVLLYCSEALFQIGDNVVDMLGADGQADGVGLNALIQQLLRRQLAVGGSGGMDDQALHISHVCQQGEDLQAVDELVRLFLTALDFKSKVLKKL